MSEQLNLSKNDTLSTVLIIAVVFLVFYYLTKPKSDRECLKNAKCTYRYSFGVGTNKKYYDTDLACQKASGGKTKSCFRECIK